MLKSLMPLAQVSKLQETALALREAATATKAAAAASAHQTALLTAHPKGDPLTFYVTAATLIPVLWIAVGWQSGAWDEGDLRTEAGKVLAVAAFLTALAVGATTIALVTLVDGDPSILRAHLVGAAMVILGGILTMAMFGPIASAHEASGVTWWWIMFVTMAVITVGATAYLLATA